MYAIVRAGGRQEKVAVGDDVRAWTGVAASRATASPCRRARRRRRAGHRRRRDAGQGDGHRRGPRCTPRARRSTSCKYKNKTGYKKRQGHRSEAHAGPQVTGITSADNARLEPGTELMAHKKGASSTRNGRDSNASGSASSASAASWSTPARSSSASAAPTSTRAPTSAAAATTRCSRCRRAPSSSAPTAVAASSTSSSPRLSSTSPRRRAPGRRSTTAALVRPSHRQGWVLGPPFVVPQSGDRAAGPPAAAERSAR